MSVCFSCKNHFNPSSTIIPCFVCANLFYATIDCMGLAASGIKVLQKRSVLLFRCSEYQSKGNSNTSIDSQLISSDLEEIKAACDALPSLTSDFADFKKQLSALHEVVEDLPLLRNQVGDMQKRMSQLEATNSKSTSEDEQIFTEMQDRISRASNIILFNIEESTNILEDLEKVKSAIEFTGIDLEAVHIKRIGKLNTNKTRPVIATLKCPSDVQTVFKNRSKLKPPIKVNFDKTKMQQNKFLEAKNELMTRQAAGESNITIKYINNIPRVVCKEMDLNMQSSKN